MPDFHARGPWFKSEKVDNFFHEKTKIFALIGFVCQ